LTFHIIRVKDKKSEKHKFRAGSKKTTSMQTLRKSMIIPSERTLIWKIDAHCFCRGPRYESTWKLMTIPSKKVLI